MGNASELTRGSAALAIFAKTLGVTEAEYNKPLDSEQSLENRLKDCKTRLQAIKSVFDQVRPRNFTDNSIGYFEQLLREEILTTVLEIPEKGANNYLGTKRAVEENLRKAIKALNLALDELEKTAGNDGSKGEFYDCLIECTTRLETILDHWDVPLQGIGQVAHP